jgi:hypothetical protein
MVFEKSSEEGWLQLPTTEPASKHKKPLQKRCRFFLEKSPAYATASNNR